MFQGLLACAILVSLDEMASAIGLRWTIGNVSEAGFEALRLSLWSAWKLFGTRAQYAVCVNTTSLDRARELTGETPPAVRWIDATRALPEWLRAYLDKDLAEGVAWKLAPVRVFPSRHEISFDNDVILWKIPEGMRRWLASNSPDACLLSCDVQPAFGQFRACCGSLAVNTGIRGLPPQFDLEARLRQMLRETNVVMQSELDEQGLQAAVLSQQELFLISTEDVSICSPFPMHQQDLGKCGAHFVGLNPKQLPWKLEGRAAHEVVRERWRSHGERLLQLIWRSVPV